MPAGNKAAQQWKEAAATQRLTHDQVPSYAADRPGSVLSTPPVGRVLYCLRHRYECGTPMQCPVLAYFLPLIFLYVCYAMSGTDLRVPMLIVHARSGTDLVCVAPRSG